MDSGIFVFESITVFILLEGEIILSFMNVNFYMWILTAVSFFAMWHNIFSSIPGINHFSNKLGFF
jgi:hypothetical protein